MKKKKAGAGAGAEANSYVICECGETCTIRRCAGEKIIYYISCTGCRSRRFISELLLASMERRKIIFTD